MLTYVTSCVINLKTTLYQTWLRMIQQQSVKLYAASIFQRSQIPTFEYKDA